MDILKIKHLDPHELFDHFDECVQMTLSRGSPQPSAPFKVNVNLRSAFEEASLHPPKELSKAYFTTGKEQEKKPLLHNKENLNPNTNSSLMIDFGAKKTSRGILRPVEAASKERFICGSRPHSQLTNIHIPSEPGLPIDKPKKPEKKLSFDAASIHTSNIVMLKKFIKEAISRPSSINTSVDGSKKNVYHELPPKRSKHFKVIGLGTSSVDNLRTSNERKPLGIMTTHVQNTSRISGLFQTNKLADSRLRPASRSGLFRKKDNSSVNYSSFNDGATNQVPKKDSSYLEQFKQRYMSTKHHHSYTSIAPQSLDNKSTESKRHRHLDYSEYLTIGDDKLISHAGRYRTEGALAANLAQDESTADTLREARLKKYIEISNIYNNFRLMLDADKTEDLNNSRDFGQPRKLPEPPAASHKPSRNATDNSSTSRYMRFEKHSKLHRTSCQPKAKAVGERLKLFAR
jgi:hypothetical protein